MSEKDVARAGRVAERVARALGCRVQDGQCGCSVEREGHYGRDGVGLLPYGEESPEGWACTGPLINVFALHLEPKPLTAGAWLCSGSGRTQVEMSPCAAIAAWVATFGAYVRDGGASE